MGENMGTEGEFKKKQFPKLCSAALVIKKNPEN